MKRRFIAVIEMSLDSKENVKYVRLSIPESSQTEFSLILTMLRYEVVEAIVIHNPEDSRSQLVEIQFDSQHVNASPTFAFENRLKLTLTERDIDCWLTFFLRYCRDGVAEVDHLDLEAESISDDGTQLSIILAVENSQPSIPGDEARRLLGM